MACFINPVDALESHPFLNFSTLSEEIAFMA